MPRPIQARIDLAALQHNYELAKAAVPGAKAWAVVKANAYGHGIERAAAALKERADGFALLDLDEAVRLRDAGVAQPILLLEGFFEPADLRIVAEHRLSAVIHCREQVNMLAKSAFPPPAGIFLKLNSGMNRLGFVAGDLDWLRDHWGVLGHSPITLVTHFSDADGARGISAQMDRFRNFSERLQSTGCAFSVANSAAILRHPEQGGEWIRPGIMLYGGSPFAALSAEQLGLRPVMTLTSALIAIQQVPAGERVGYGGRFQAGTAMRIGVVACGYADGYPRHAPDGTPLLVDGLRAQLIGRVSMDMITVDLSECPDARVGSRVTLWGDGLPADEVASAAGTISYELFCALARRVPTWSA